MALPLRERWDVTHLAAKYPWLRVDQAALEEFRSPFRWVPDTPPLPHSSTENSDRDGSDDDAGGRPRRHGRERKARTESKGEGLEVEKRPKVRKKMRTKTHAIARGHKQLPSPTAKSRRNNSPPSYEPSDSPLRLSVPVEEEPLAAAVTIATPTILVCQDAGELGDTSNSVLETLRHDHEALLKLRNRKKKKVKRKVPSNVLTLRFPVLVSKPPASHTQPSSSSIEDGNWSSSASILLDKYTRELASLTQEEQRLEQGVLTRIAEEKARLPLTFLFEHNLLHRSDAQQDGLRIVTAIFAQLQHRLLFSGFARWRGFLSSTRREERQQEVLRLARLRAVKLLERVSSDAYVGTLDRGFQRWKRAGRLLIEQERHQAATVIQTAFRTRRARQHLLILRQAAKARDHRRELAVQALLRFERYGFTMKWGALRVGFDLVRQTRAARSLQLFLRRTRRHAATLIQCQFRGWNARGSYQSARLAVITIQCAVRCALARRKRGRRLGATVKLQGWAKGVLLCRVARRVLEEMKVQAQRREALALLLQKRARQIEAQQTARLLREALKVVKIEQRRYFGTEDGGVHGGTGWVTHQTSSELLAFVTERFLEDDTCFTLKETRWLRAQVQAAYERLAREDQATVFLQRRYRGYATRLGYWVHRCQMEQLRQLKEVKAVVLQRIARGWLARRQTHRLREQRRKLELKEAYVRERRRKDEEREWKERVDREQMELRVQQAHEAEAQIREARREADIARIKAEAAAYRAQELAAELEIKAVQEALAAKKANEKEEEMEGDKWTELADEFGNVYYCNERTGESCWDRPPPPPKKEEKPLVEEAKAVSTDAKAEELKVQQTKEDEECKIKAALEEKGDLERALREGKCRTCRRVQATKQCLDCEDTAHAKFCTACFTQEHPRLSNSSECHHDFAVLPSAQARVARCQSALHSNTGDSENQQPPGLRLATYFCLECTAATHPDSESESKLKLASDSELRSESKLKLDAAGCFYCDECFAGSHETTQELQHVEKALQFCRGASLCCDCGHTLAVRLCEQCGDKFCASCFVTAHTSSKRRLTTHSWTPLKVIREPLVSETDVYCVDCDLRASSRLCNLCGDGFCDSCFAVAHAKGAKRSHTWLPWAVAAQHGDWLEIQDNNSTLFFNVETKESTVTRPSALLPGDERHRLQLAEREQLQRRRQIELESEVVKLKEQLIELQDSQQQQTQRRQRLGSHASKPTRHLEAPGEQKKPDEAKKAAKPGLLSRLYPRRPRSQPERNDVAPEETKSLAKEKIIGSPAFQQAVLQELAALAQTPDGKMALHPSALPSSPRGGNGNGHSKRLPSLPQRREDAATLASTAVSSDVEVAKIGEMDVVDPNGSPSGFNCVLDDAEGLVLDVIDEIMTSSAKEAVERLMFRRLLGFVASWGAAMITEALVSAIAPTGDVGIDSSGMALDPVTTLLACVNTEPEKFEPPDRCPPDVSYQRNQVPMRSRRQEDLENEALYRAVRDASGCGGGSRARAASVASSRLTANSRRRRKHQETTITAAPEGPQPGVVFNTEPAESRAKHRILSPRKVMAMRNAALHKQLEDPMQSGSRESPWKSIADDENAVVGLHLNLDIDGLGQSGARTLGSPPAFASFDGVKGDEGGQQDEPLLDVDLLDQNFQSMPLSPGVKLQAGDASLVGPELPLFGRRMRKSTFVVSWVMLCRLELE
ncbi:hypothetical protein BBJ28_00007433 [Nothophytophthora sp. Chile5]|nr:hypothetical protein BBJ28_00007433 [Nothophytophthora sp. Chile5]